MQTNSDELPMVSVCTPTFNRRPFIQNMFNCFKNQDYPMHRIEWIIVDDGTDKIQDLILDSNIPQIRYFEVPEKMTLGAKRNYMHTFVRGSIIVYMDDDDYYPPERISHAVERLLGKPEAMCAGSSEIYLFFKSMNKMIQCGPYNANHATAGTFAFRTEMLKTTHYEDHAALAEERAFLKDYTIPFVQLDPLKTILVFSHDHNTFDKRKMFDQQQDPRVFKESTKTVDTFIRNSNESSIKHFFMQEIDDLLENYAPGRPDMKPDVLKQIKEIEAKRDKMIEDATAAQKANGAIVLQRPGQEPLQLTSEQVVQIVKDLQTNVKDLQTNVASLQEKDTQNTKYVGLLQQKLIDLKKTPINTSDNDNNQLTEILAANQSLQQKLIANISESSALKREHGLTNQSLQDQLTASVNEIAALKHENTRLTQLIIDIKPDNKENITYVATEIDKSTIPDIELPQTKSRPEIIIDITDV
jgi:glycosyltransferase involved in cell wall biosynthesis